MLFEHAHRSGRTEHHRHLVFFNQAPPDTAVRASGQTFVHDGGHAANQRAINDVTVTHHPSNVTGGKIGFARVTCVNVFHAGGERHAVTTSVALHAFRFAGGAAGVQGVTGVSGIDPLAFNHRIEVLFAQGAPQVVTSSYQLHSNQTTVSQQHSFWLVL